MDISETQIDAAFYTFIHQLTDLEKAGVERREEQRQPFQTTQWIAPRNGLRIPPPEKFVEIQCYDLTRAGFSFLVTVPPPFKTMVVALGGPIDGIYMGAVVVRCTSVLRYPTGLVTRPGRPQPGQQGQIRTGDAEPALQVGCRFTDRIPRPTRV
jgi:hypothetical protein